MKNLVLLRHAKSSWDYDVADRNRPLAKKGIQRIQAMAKVCESTFTSVQQYYSSPANRALHTATILFHELQLPMKRLQLDEALYTFEASKVLTAVPFSLIDTLLVDAPASLPDEPVIVGAVSSAVVKLRDVLSLIPA